jgi:hypothetical protein
VRSGIERHDDDREIHLTWGSAPLPGSAACGDPYAPRHSLAGAPCAPSAVPTYCPEGRRAHPAFGVLPQPSPHISCGARVPSAIGVTPQYVREPSRACPLGGISWNGTSRAFGKRTSHTTATPPLRNEIEPGLNAEFAGSFHRRSATVTAAGDTTCMASSYTLDLPCGCTVYVARHPRTGLAHTRVIEARGRRCQVRRHAVGVRLWLWELLPEPGVTNARVRFEVSDPESAHGLR